ncbi:hypothetical protein DPX16_18217 [Anabarilius grahami]|uniref:Uncharacterized protein n=1 Tax=Anabarilius grahami TaxID=495550 RepID=A0A3N0Y7V8_ANAGA|nr:hypothetical protein DPX16_18217 [Anabarilius grahami]
MTLCLSYSKIYGGSGGRRENPIWQAQLFLLPGPDNGFLPPTIELEELAKHGLGFELARTGKGRKIQKLQGSFVKELKAVVGKSRLYIVPRATVLQVTSPPSAMSQNSFPPLAAPAVDETSQVVSDQEKSFGFSVYYQVASTSSAISMNSFPPLSIAPVQEETAPVAESTQAQSVVANQILFDFVGQDDIASEIFVVQERIIRENHSSYKRICIL